MNSSSFTTPQSIRIQPDYTEAVVTEDFATNDDYDIWFNNVASKHAVFIFKGDHRPSTYISGRPTMSLYFICDHAGSPRKKADETPGGKRRKTTKATIKVGCTSKFTKHVYADGAVKVVYQWIHENHDPLEMEDIGHSRLPVELRNWIVDCVDRHMNLKSIKAFLRLNIDQLDELDSNIADGRFPPSLIIKQQDVVNVVNEKLNKISRKHAIDRFSVYAWVEYLKSKNHHTLLFEQENGPFVVAWYSEWQKEKVPWTGALTRRITHASRCSILTNIATCTPSLSGLLSPTRVFLLPSFMLTASEIIPNLVKWLQNIKDSNNLNVARIMIDCSTTEIAAIRQVFDGVDVLLCHWHIKRAWDLHIKKDIKGGNRFKTKALRDGVRVSIDEMMETSSPAQFDEMWTSFEDKKELWAKAYRQVCTNVDARFHTNNLIESYHNQLKTLYLGRKRQNRMDRTIYILSQVMIADYRLEALQVFHKIKQFSLTRSEKMAKNQAEEVDENTAYSIIVKINEELYSCRSFTNPDVIYQLIVSQSGYVSSCSCSFVSGICKHMFLLSRIKVIPYYANHSAPFVSTSANATAPATVVSTSTFALASAPSDVTTATNNFEFDNCTFLEEEKE
ncbi:hypothetical protein [Absidia glauca]|uniref:SWIM-type domain-containing protein n=1 Tax=Absidia glauca TaxID=4829 RepID=A0A168PVI8_ABSGL|nr:hypothetical protein [Absidia glauca]